MFALRSSYPLDPFLMTSCSARCSLSCSCIDDSLLIEKRVRGILHRAESLGWFSFCWNQSGHPAFPMHPYSTVSYFSWNSMVSNSLLHIACRPLLFGAAFQSKMCSIFCYPLFIILKDSFLLPSKTSENYFYSLYFHFLKWHWKVQRSTAARVWGVRTLACHHLNVTPLIGEWSWEQLPISTIAGVGFWPFYKKGKKTHIGDNTAFSRSTDAERYNAKAFWQEIYYCEYPHTNHKTG